MTVRIAINGFGRIGRNILRAIHESGRTDLTVVALNDLGDVETNAHLLRYDSVHGRFPGTIKVAEGSIDIGAGPIRVLSERDPARLPWADLGIDVALECTGIFTAREKAAAHLEAGARAVLISAPGTDSDLTVVYGVNHQALTREHRIVSNASCTTNCLAPVASVLHDAIGIASGFMTTVHAYTLDQPVLDTLAQGPAAGAGRGGLDDPHLYRGRARRGARAPRPRRQARRHCGPGSNRQCLDGRSQLRRQAVDNGG